MPWNDDKTKKSQRSLNFKRMFCNYFFSLWLNRVSLNKVHKQQIISTQNCFLYMVISQYYHKFNKSGLSLTLQSRRFFQPEVDSKHLESEWNQDSESGSITLCYQVWMITRKNWICNVKNIKNWICNVKYEKLNL